MDTMTATPEVQASSRRGAELILIWRSQDFRLPANSDSTLSLGLHRSNDLVVPGTYLSRRHASINWRRNGFELVDHSTNGTFVQLEDGQISHVHRSSIRLWGAGYLSFGEPLTLSTALGFRHA